MAYFGQVLALIAVPIGFWAVGMMIYAQSKAMSAPTVAENRAWKSRYYRNMGLFLIMWIVTMIGVGLAKAFER